MLPVLPGELDQNHLGVRVIVTGQVKPCETIEKKKGGSLYTQPLRQHPPTALEPNFIKIDGSYVILRAPRCWKPPPPGSGEGPSVWGCREDSGTGGDMIPGGRLPHGATHHRPPPYITRCSPVFIQLQIED